MTTERAARSALDADMEAFLVGRAVVLIRDGRTHISASVLRRHLRIGHAATTRVLSVLYAKGYIEVSTRRGSWKVAADGDPKL